MLVIHYLSPVALKALYFFRNLNGFTLIYDLHTMYLIVLMVAGGGYLSYSNNQVKEEIYNSQVFSSTNDDS